MENAVIVRHEKTTAVIPMNMEEMYNTYFHHILGMVRARVGTDACYDLATDIFLKIIFNLEKYKNQGKGLLPWVRTITYNEIMQRFRLRKRDPGIHAADISEMYHLAYEESEKDPLMQDWPLVKELLLNLDEFSLKLIVLRFFKRRSYRQIAHELNINENNAKVKMFRLLARLRKELIQKKKKANQKSCLCF